MAKTTTGTNPTSFGRGGRMSSQGKRDAVLRLLRGEDLELVSRSLGVTAATLSGWRDAFLAAGEASLAIQPTDGETLHSERLEARRAETDTSGATPRLINLPMSSQPIYESGATLFAYLAFPGPDEEKERAHALITLCTTALHVMATKDPASVWVPQPIKPGYLIFSEESVDRVLRTFGRRLRDRLVAALMAFPLLKEAETGCAEMPPGVTRLSVAQLATYAAAFSGEESPVNVRSRVWTPSLPVIHLALATVITTHRGREAGATDLDVHLLCCNPYFIRMVVREAEKYERLLPLVPKLQLALERLFRFRLA